MLQHNFGALLGVTACVFFILGVLVSPAFAQQRRVKRAIQGLSERYVAEVQRATAERQAWAGERVVLTGMIKADNVRAAEKNAQNEALRNLVAAKDRALIWVQQEFNDISDGTAIRWREFRAVVERGINGIS